MCGIVGILKPSSQGLHTEVIEKMASTLMHRGPDSWGTYVSKDIALGHTRLSIVDIQGGHQPMASDRYVIVYNGEIFNHIELKVELEQTGVKFKTTCDTEVALKAFEVFGPEAFKKFNGQFAILLWDKTEKTLFIVRDRLGIRPLYILNIEGSYYFSSEVKAFDTINAFQRRYNVQNLFEHALLWNTLGDNTVFNNIRSLPAGTYEIYRLDQSPKQFRYYEIGESPPPCPAPSFEQATKEFTELLRDAVRLRLRSDVPVATYLSGGVDSAVTTHLTSLIKTEQFKTFSVAFSDHEFDESSYQKEMVARLNSEHTEIQIDYKSIDSNLLEAIYYTERPVFRTAPVPLFLLSKEVNKQGIKVVLTGEGADEILFGYDSFKELKLLDFWSKQPNSTLRPQLIKRLYPHLHHYSDPRKFGLLRMYYEGFLTNFNNDMVSLNIRVHNNKAITNFFNKDFKLVFDHNSLLDKIKQTLPNNFSSWSLLQKNQFLEIKTLLSGYLLSSQGDRMSMAHSVEGRYPFLDYRLIEKIFHYPDNYKLKNFKQKYLLTKAFEQHIPSSILNRPKRPYMAPDLKSFFTNNQLTDTAGYFLSERIIDEYGLFDKKNVSRLVQKFKNEMPENVGYRDNMLITFILSSQMVYYWTINKQISRLDKRKKTTEIIDNN